MQLKVVLDGHDKRLAENVMLEVRALARRCGLEVADVKVVSRRAAKPKKLTRRRRASRG
jgi:hypothetical protein